MGFQNEQRGFILLNEPQKREINLVDDIQKSEFTLEKPPRENSRNQRLISVTSDNEALQSEENTYTIKMSDANEKEKRLGKKLDSLQRDN